MVDLSVSNTDSTLVEHGNNTISDSIEGGTGGKTTNIGFPDVNNTDENGESLAYGSSTTTHSNNDDYLSIEDTVRHRLNSVNGPNNSDSCVHVVQNGQHATSTTQPILSVSNIDADDTRADEEEEDNIYSGRWPADDPYVYSDDSASLSDAYFFPQSDDDLGRPSTGRNRHDESDSLTGGRISPGQTLQAPQYPLATYYGSISNTSHTHYNYHPHGHYVPQHRNLNSYHLSPAEQRAPSPLWMSAGSIQEDSEEIIPINPHPFQIASQSTGHDGSFLLPSTARVLRKDKRRQTRLGRNGWSHYQQQKQREKQANRERLVNQVRGRPQNNEARDVIWMFIFLAQFLFVCISALYYGNMFVHRNSNMDWTHFLPNPAAGSHFHHFDGSLPIPQTNEIIPVLAVLVHNETTDELQYNENLLKNETSKLTTQQRIPALTTMSLVSTLNAEVTDSTGPAFDNEPFTIDYQNSVALLSITGFFTLVLGYATFGLMLILSRAVIQIMLIFSVILALAWGVIGLSLDPYGVISVLGFAVLLLTLGFAIYHWQRVPFAATNLNTALNALRCTTDIALLGFGCLFVTFVWLMTWFVAFIGIVNTLNQVECDKVGGCHHQFMMEHAPVYLLMLFSFHWTNTVIKNILRVTVATVIGTWWFYPSDIGCICTAAVAKPLWRALTKSLGSICLGSLIVQPAQIIAKIGSCGCYASGNSESACLAGHVHPAEKSSQPNNLAVVTTLSREDDDGVDGSSGLCQKFCSVFDRIHATASSYNRWSYTYIGMYGYGFSEGGALALKLFETREWLDIVKDGLIHNVLWMASLVIGGSAGIFAVIVEESGGFVFSSFHKPVISAFAIGSILGYVMSNVLLLGVVGSAANTILVCFAAGPFEFDKNHPALSREMREVWSQQVWEPSI